MQGSLIPDMLRLVLVTMQGGLNSVSITALFAVLMSVIATTAWQRGC